MHIEVIIAGWEQECCGAPFKVGDHMTWQLHAASPSDLPDLPDLPEVSLLRFFEEHHGQTPHGVPHGEVSGVVVAITGTNFPLLPMAGEPRSFTVDTKNPQNSPLMSVGYPGDSSFQQYGAILAVADGVVLPQYAPGQAQEEAESDALMDQRNQSRRHDPVGNLLEALADHAQSQYRNIATIVRSSERSAVTVKPHNADSAAIYWSRSNQYDDGILASVGDGTWELSASVSDAGLVAEFLAAAAAGHVEERVRHGTSKTKYLATEITTADGRVWADSAEFETFDMEEGTFAVAGELWDRFEKGDHKYQAWG